MFCVYDVRDHCQVCSLILLLFNYQNKKFRLLNKFELSKSAKNFNMLPEITCKIKRCGVELKYFTQTTDYEDLYEALDLFDLKFNIVMNELLKNVPVLVADCPDDEASDDSTAEGFKEQVSCKKMKK